MCVQCVQFVQNVLYDLFVQNVLYELFVQRIVRCSTYDMFYYKLPPLYLYWPCRFYWLDCFIFALVQINVHFAPHQYLKVLKLSG